MKRIAVVTAGLSQPSSSRLLADRLASASGLPADTFELRDTAHDVVNHLLTGFPSGKLQPVLDAVTEADGLIAVTATFNASYNGLFKSFFDVLGEGALVDKPVLLGATGGSPPHTDVLEHANNEEQQEFPLVRPAARRGTRSCWSTRCGRSSVTCGRS